jgi:hypothetical protein
MQGTSKNPRTLPVLIKGLSSQLCLHYESQKSDAYLRAMPQLNFYELIPFTLLRQQYGSSPCRRSKTLTRWIGLKPHRPSPRDSQSKPAPRTTTLSPQRPVARRSQPPQQIYPCSSVALPKRLGTQPWAAHFSIVQQPWNVLRPTRHILRTRQ